MQHKVHHLLRHVLAFSYGSVAVILVAGAVFNPVQADSLVLTAAKTSYAEQEQVTVSWVGASGGVAADWVALVPAGGQWKAGMPWVYTGATTASTTKLAGLSYGLYDIVYYKNNGFVERGRTTAAFAVVPASSTLPASTEVVQYINAWKAGKPLPPSTGQITTLSTCRTLVQQNLTTAGNLGYTVDLAQGTYTHASSGIMVKQGCVPTGSVYKQPAAPYDGPVPPLDAVACPHAGAETDVWLVIGQSNAGNSGSGRHPGVPNTYAYAGNGLCYPAADPLRGGDGTDSAPWVRLAAKMLGQKKVDGNTTRSIVIISRAIGGTSIEQWAYEPYYQTRLTNEIADAISRGYRPSRVFWHQGEANSRGFNTSAQAYVDAFLTISERIKAAGVGAPIWVATASICNPRTPVQPNHDAAMGIGPDSYIGLEAGRDIVRQAQKALQGINGIVAGPNTDLIAPALRIDGCHFGPGGLDAHAEMWFDALQKPIPAPPPPAAPAPVPTLAINVNGAESIAVINGTPYQVNWGAAHVDSCSLSESVNDGAPRQYSTALSGGFAGTMMGNYYVYTLTCQAAGQSYSKTIKIIPKITVSVNVDNVQHLIRAPGQNYTINWGASNAKACVIYVSIGGGALIPYSYQISGSSPGSGESVSRVYAMNCTGYGGQSGSQAAGVYPN